MYQRNSYHAVETSARRHGCSGGTIQALSAGLGTGTTIRVRLRRAGLTAQANRAGAAVADADP